MVPWEDQVQPARSSDPRVAAELARRSVSLEHLSLAHMVDANDFLAACDQTWTWSRLQSLALTTKHLQGDYRADGNWDPADAQLVDGVLFRAGTIALQMPRLQTLVLWSEQIGDACAFMYTAVDPKEGNTACITWRGTWEAQLSPNVVGIWEKVARTNKATGKGLPLRWRSNKFERKRVFNNGDAIRVLDMPVQVVAPASLCQMLKERIY